MNNEDGITKIQLIKNVRNTFPNMSLYEAKKYVEKMESIAKKYDKEVKAAFNLSNFTVQYTDGAECFPAALACKKAPCIMANRDPSPTPIMSKETVTKDANMHFYDDECDEGCEMTDNTKHYVTNRLYDIRSTKNCDLQKTFGLCDDSPPESVNELVARIKDGKFTLTKGYDGTEIVYDPIRFVKWRNPAVKEDKAGYNTAVKALNVVYQDAVDTVTVISDEAARLKVLKDFEAVTVQ